jgi:hypothetical protein
MPTRGPHAEIATASSLTPERACQIAQRAYVFGYPLVLMDLMRQVMTAVPRATAYKAPINQFVHTHHLPDDTDRDVACPSGDTLQSLAWLDLSHEPIVLSLPDVGRRFCMMQLMDAWTNVFASPGPRTTGGTRGDFAIVGPRWLGRLPLGLRPITAPTNMVWLIGRTQAYGKSECPAAQALQRQYRLTPLSAWGRPFAMPANVPVASSLDPGTPPSMQIASLGAMAFIERLNALMVGNPPSPDDAGLIERLSAIGVEPGTLVDATDFDQDVEDALEQGIKAGYAEVRSQAWKAHGTSRHGWNVLPANTARFGTDYLWRATVAYIGLGASLRDDTVCPLATTDGCGRPLTGANRYELRFPKGQLPPVHAFWTISMYDAEQHLVPNPINRFAIGDRDSLVFDDDGSLTIFVQPSRPAGRRHHNWLPAPPGRFSLLMRLYWPKPEVLDETWQAPPVMRVDQDDE